MKNSQRFSSETAPTHHLLQRFCQSAKGYWGSQGPPGGWVVTLSLGSVVLASLAITYSINLWNRSFFDALEAKNAAVAMQQAILFPALIALYLLLCVFAMWARMTLQRTWRAWLNQHLLRRWLSNSRFYQLELVGGDHKNPEHRINDDLRIATEMPVDFVTGFVTAVLSALAFFSMLWIVGGSLNLELAGIRLHIPGFVVIAALVYACIANGTMLAIALRFIPITQEKNQAEAEYRYALTRVRENAESIALLGAGEAENLRLGRAFGNVVARWRDLMGQHMRAVIVSQGSAQLCGVVPILLCTPRYLDNSMTLGQIMQVASAFTIVQGALSWFMENYTRLADWTASAKRVASLMTALDRVERDDTDRLRHSYHGDACTDGALRLRNVSVKTPDERLIIRRATLTIRPGERVLITGKSGTGKSSLIRAIAGCWAWSSGEIARPEERLLVVPQRPYLPTGTLREAVIYPLPADHVSARNATEALAATGLAHFVPQLDNDAPWETRLSEGEKQRLAIARALLLRPQILALDEATSALHVAGQAEIMAVIARELPGTTIISIGHRPELEAFHQRKLTIARHPDGAVIVQDVPIASSTPTFSGRTAA